MRDSNKYRRWLVEQCECSPDYFGGDIILRDNKRKCNYTGCSRKNAVWHDKFWTIRCKICFLHHNVRQRLLSNSRRKICVNGLIYSLLNIQVITHWQWSRLHVNIEHSGLPVDKCFPTSFSRQIDHPTHLIWILWIIHLGVLFSAGVSSEDKDISHLKQVLNSCWDVISQGTNQRCYWPVV